MPALPLTTQNMTPYGDTQVPIPGLPDAGSSEQAAQLWQDGPGVVLNDTTSGSARAQEARAMREVGTETGIAAAVGAGIREWSTTKLVKRIGRPHYKDDTPVNMYEFIDNLPIVPTDDEHEYLMDAGKTGVQAAMYAAQQVVNGRNNKQILGEHPITGLVTMFADPVWLAVPPAFRAGKLVGVGGRVVSGVVGAGVAGGVVAAGEGPKDDTEIAMNMLFNGAAAAMLFKPGKGLTRLDAEFPSAELRASIPTGIPKSAAILDSSTAASRASPKQIVQAVDSALTKDGVSRGLGDTLAWNMHKTLSSFGDVGKRVADTLLDNNADLSINALESHREAILQPLKSMLYDYGDTLREQMAKEGHGTLSQLNPMTSRTAYAKQLEIENQVYLELARREQFTRQGIPLTDTTVPTHIAKMADQLDALHKRALSEMKSAGVEGAESLLERQGYMNRRWSSAQMERVIDRFERAGLTREAAHGKVVDLVALGIRRANGFEPELAREVASATVSRALNKGYFEDAVFNSPMNAATQAELRSVLQGHVSPDRLERALGALRVQTDEAGKVGFMKHRMDLDHKAEVRVGGDVVKVTDLIDTRVFSIVDQYTSRVATEAAFARKGMPKRSDITKLRDDLSKGTAMEQRGKAIELFDNIIANWMGEPSGQKMNENFRLLQAYTRAISLVWGGLWQATEYATSMASYGALKTLKYAAQELPGFKQLMRPTKQEAGQLKDILADYSSDSMRMRPFVARFEDGYEMDAGSALQLAAQPMGHMVPMANGMKYVHHHQANVVGNLVVDRLGMAAKGDPKAREALLKYGLEYPVMDRLAKEIEKHGFKVDAWSDGVWESIRPALGKMMDEGVLRGRLGDMPAFAAFDNVGKFLFTYRTFVLVAHNKLLAGGLQRDGAGAVGMILMYQLPLALMAVQAQSVAKGEGTLKDGDLVKRAVGQMGGLGLFSEPWKWATGESNAIGAPGLIAADRGVKTFSGVLQGDPKQAASAALTMLPVVTTNPVWNSMVKQTFSKEK